MNHEGPFIWEVKRRNKLQLSESVDHPNLKPRLRLKSFTAAVQSRTFLKVPRYPHCDSSKETGYLTFSLVSPLSTNVHVVTVATLLKAPLTGCRRLDLDPCPWLHSPIAMAEGGAKRGRLHGVGLLVLCCLVAVPVHGQGSFGGPTNNLVVWYKLNEPATSNRARVSLRAIIRRFNSSESCAHSNRN
jgi:hypothetical protein